MTNNSAGTPSPVELFHDTCLKVAMKVCETETWKFSDSGGDRGMNLFDARPDFTTQNQIPHTGARLFFRWLGKPAIKVSFSSNIVGVKDTLYDQHPWRMFVGPDLSPGLMQIVRIELIDQTGRCEKCGDHGPVGWIDKFCPSKRSVALRKMVDHANQRLLQEKFFIKEMTKIIDFRP